jgi:predicted alpha/beta hydrolase family esterase
MGGLGEISPGLAGWWGARRFLTPPRHAAPDRERELLARGRATEVRVDGRRIAVWHWGSDPLVGLVHGWGGRGAQLGAFVDPLLSRGLGVIAFDAPAHGQSEGRRVSIPEMAAALRAVVERVGPVRGLVAHSGGAAVCAWALREWLRDGFVEVPGAIALVAPAAWLGAYLDGFADALGLHGTARARMRVALEARVGRPPEAFDLAGFTGTLPPGALVVHDRADAEVPWTDGLAVARAWPGAELVTTHGLGHRRILRDPDVVARVTEFMVTRLADASAPSRFPAALLC